MKKPRLVICDDEMLIRLWLSEHLTDAGYQTETTETGAELLAAVEREPADVVILDLRLPDQSGIDLLPRLKEHDPNVAVIMMTAYGEIETAVAAVRAGAFHFLEKPTALPELRLLLEQALESRRLRGEVDRFRDGCRWLFADVALVGRSAALRRVAELITRVAMSETAGNVLIQGESGTGKGIVARAIHARGPRHAHPFVSVNCTALPDTLLESELFGHEAGAYTDARETKRGLLELADRGTVFLDEIGDLPKSAQAKVLHFLEEHAFRRVGGTRNIDVDVQVISATNRRLEEAVSAGDFREDLYYRLNVLPIVIPPLRERPDDIAPLAMHFVDTFARERHRSTAREITPQAVAALERHAWPGNARELRNVIERVMLLDDAPVIGLEHFPSEIRGTRQRPQAFVLPAAGLDLETVEREFICQALDRANGNKTGAARLLGLSRDTLRYRLEKYGIH